MNFFQKLSEPYGYDTSYRSFLRVAVIISAFVFGLLFVFKPFGMDVIQAEKILPITLGYSMVTFSIMHLNWLLFQMFGFKEENWVIWKEIIWSLWNFGTIAIGNWTYNLFLFGDHFNVQNFAAIFFITIAVGSIPLTLVIFLSQIRRLKKNLAEAQQMNSQFQVKKEGSQKDEDLIEFVAENGKDRLEVNLNDLLFLESTNNYVDLYIRIEHGFDRQVMRNSMKRMEETLQGHPSFFRCHRTYVVNLDCVENISGNSAGYSLNIGGTDLNVPVSRQKVEEFRALIRP